MSLNRCEQRIFDYLESNTEERQYWRKKVHSVLAGAPSPAAGICLIERELWTYYAERSSVAPPFREAALREGLQRMSLRTLAELLARLRT